MKDPATGSGVSGLFLSRAATLLSVGHTRLELLGNELEVGRITAMRQLMFALALLFCLGLGLVLTVISLTIWFWEQRLFVVSFACILVWALSLAFYFLLRNANQRTEPLFAASLAELREDLRQLREATSDGRSPH